MYFVCFFAKVIFGAIAIGMYHAYKDIENDFALTLLYAILSSVLIFVCGYITIWQFDGI